MVPNSPITDFLSRTQDDHRIGVTHITVYAALTKFSCDRGAANPITAYSYEIMGIAKISALYTYCRCMLQLNEYGYIAYRPSKKKNRPSTIELLWEPLS
jgi:hypothetical protein